MMRMIPSTQKWARHYKGWCSRQVMLHRKILYKDVKTGRDESQQQQEDVFYEALSVLSQYSTSGWLLWMLRRTGDSGCCQRCNAHFALVSSRRQRDPCGSGYSIIISTRGINDLFWDSTIIHESRAMVQRLLSVPRCNPVLDVVRRSNYYHGSRRID